jgi:hypothetical protein
MNGDNEMNARHREFLQAETGRRLESMLSRFGQVREVVPWLRPGQSHSSLRRTAARLRSGAIRGLDPRIPAHVLADTIEKSIAQELLVKSVLAEMRELDQLFRECEEKEETARGRRLVAGFHRLKKSPEASDPESPAAQRVRRTSRERRNEMGRGRKGSKGE